MRVLGHAEEGHAVLSLRPSQGGAVADRPAASAKAGAKRPAAGAAAAEGPASAAEVVPELVDVASLKPGALVTGYVKRCDSKGLFLAVDRQGAGRGRGSGRAG